MALELLRLGKLGKQETPAPGAPPGGGGGDRLPTRGDTDERRSQCGQIPILDKLLVKSPIARRIMPSNHVVRFTLDLVNERLATPVDRHDFLSAFLKAKEEHPGLVDDRQVTSYSVTNVFAGSDTTAISLRSAFYYLLKNPAMLRKLVAEIDTAVGDRNCVREPITFAESRTLPYLQAVLKEAMRIHPAVGMLLERYVPQGGFTISGAHLPEGTIVGINPWVLHRNKEVYGQDADEFRPERWLEADTETLKAMDRSFLAVGLDNLPPLLSSLSFVSVDSISY